MTRGFDRRRFLAEAMASPLFGAALGANLASGQTIQVEPRTQLKDSVHTQVVVVGAGASGVPAALAAARAGAKVILLEADAVPGGAPVDMYVTLVCGGPVVGIYSEMLGKLDHGFHLAAEPDAKRSSSVWFTPSAYVHVISRMIGAEPNLQLWCSAPVTEVLVTDGSTKRVRGVVVRHPDGRVQTVEADVVVDATGTGLVSALAGCECRYGTEAKTEHNEPMGPDQPSNQVQLCTLMLIAQRLRPDTKIDPAKLKGYMALPSDGAHAYLCWSGTVACRDTRCPLAVADAHREAIAMIEADVAYFYANGFTAHVAPQLGIREVRRVVGDHVLSVNDLTCPQRPDDTVALGTYGLDAWGDSHGSYEKSKITITPGGYGIPLRSLLAKGMDNLLVVGKCASATHLAMSAVRVQCIVAQMGQAAGSLAALATSKGVALRSVAVAELQSHLKATGIPL